MGLIFLDGPHLKGFPTLFPMTHTLCCQQCSITLRVGGLIEVVVAIGDRDLGNAGFERFLLLVCLGGETKLEGKGRCRYNMLRFTNITENVCI